MADSGLVGFALCWWAGLGGKEGGSKPGKSDVLRTKAYVGYHLVVHYR